MTTLSQIVDQCWDCRICAGAGYQIPPILYAGNFKSPILIIAQNPGQIDPRRHKSRADWMMKATRTRPSPEEIISFYNWDFGTSLAEKQFESVFGPNWWSSEKFCYTNAVRCRTFSNSYPSNQMQTTCQKWTSGLLKRRRLLVPVGRLALDQLLRMGLVWEEWGKPTVQPSGPFEGVVMYPIMHYSARRGYKQNYDIYRIGFEESLRLAELETYFYPAI